MPRPLRSSFVVALLGAALLSAGGIALAGGGKPAKPPLKSPPGMAEPTVPASGAESLGSIEWSFEDQDRDARKAMTGRRYEAILAYVKAHGTAPDVEEARSTLVDLAEALEDWGKVVQHADEFLAAHPQSESKVAVLLSRAQALSNLEKEDEAKKAFEGIVKDPEFGKQDPRSRWSAWSEYASYLASLDDVAGARKAYESAKEEVSEASEVADQAILELDLVGKEATEFPDSAKDMDGKPVGLAAFKGKILLIDFWATWCGPCRGEMPNVIEAYGKFHDKGLEIVGVSLDHANQADRVRQFTSDKKMPWRQVYYADGENAVAKEFNVNAIPRAILVDRDGKILRNGIRGKALGRTLAHVLAAKPAGKQ